MNTKAYLGPAILAILMAAAWPLSAYAQNLQWVGSYDSLSFATEVKIDDNTAYICDATRGLILLGISDPAQPTFLASYNTPYWEYDISARSGLAFIGSGISEPYLGGLYIVNTTGPDPYLMGSLSFNWEVTAVLAVGDYVYLTTYGNNYVIDISDPGTPQIVRTFDTPGTVMNYYYNNYLFAADGSAGLTILDISDPTNPQLVGNCDTPGLAAAVSTSSLVRGYAYVADYDSGLAVIDIQNPSALTLAGTIRTPDRARDIDVIGSYAGVAADDSGLVIIQVNDPDSLRIIARGATLTPAEGLDHRGSYVYVASHSSMQVFLFNPADCHYVPGDVNGTGIANGIDVTYAVSYFKGGPLPPYSCDCPLHGVIYPAGDVNGSCAFNGCDITYFVNCLEGQEIRYCPDCPPAP